MAVMVVSVTIEVESHEPNWRIIIKALRSKNSLLGRTLSSPEQ